VFAVVMGVAIAQCGEDGKPLLSFFESISIVMMKVGKSSYDRTKRRKRLRKRRKFPPAHQVTTWIIHLAPVGVCFLIAGQILEMEVSTLHTLAASIF
jgi:Na+/H+-dicarboxylate symporter